ncbi:virginiamycin B lyase family protein [Cryptosporangium japonicum]|uniref:Virginiamycin B lyase n=1 Tax=Cryptosporangium japonicum TaxID=80872 RepID=A0ABN0TGR7_9ACTN
MSEVVLTGAPYAVTGDADGTVWATILTRPGLARVRHGEVIYETLPDRPMLLTLAPDGALWYTAGDRLGRRDPAGEHTVTALPAGSAPYGIAAAPDGTIWFTAPGRNQLGCLGDDLVLLDLPVPDARAAMLTVAPDGTVWAALNGAGALARVRDGSVEVVELPDGSAPVGVAASASGVWFADIAGGRVGRVDPSGHRHETRFDATSRPHAVAADGSGGCWVTLWGSGELARIAADGAVTIRALPGTEPHGLWVSPTTVWVAMESGSLVAIPTD